MFIGGWYGWVAGKTGAGVYGFNIGTTTDKDNLDVVAPTIEWAWERSAAGGYNKGCLVIFAADGVVIKKQPETTFIPPGAISFDGVDQYCSCSDNTQVAHIVFDEEAIIYALGKEFDALGYSRSYHDALMEAAKQTRPESTHKRHMPSFVQEALPKRTKKPTNFNDLVWEMWDDKLFAMDPETGKYYSPDEWAHYKYEQQQKTSVSSAGP
jgi:hypothetical protein